MKISDLKPKNVFSFFEELCSIPHPSGYTSEMADYLVEFAKNRKLDFYRDKANNVIIRKPASRGYEKSEPVIIQGHIDMVPAKDEGVEFDFKKDAIPAFIEGDWIKTKGTTLGGDDGIAVAMMLAVLDDTSLKHPALEALFTSDEETGMVGAFALNPAQLNGRRLINIDSEEEGKIICGCAGGKHVKSTVPVKRHYASGKMITIKIDGLAGGHSGLEINKGRANANVLMTRILCALHTVMPYGLVDMNGGTKETAITSSAEAVLLIDKTYARKLKMTVRKITDVFNSEYAGIENGLNISIEESDCDKVSVLTKESLSRVLNVLSSLPYGVFLMSRNISDLVQTSSNLGILKLNSKNLSFTNSVRSSVQSELDWVCKKIGSITELAGGRVITDSGYSSWLFNQNSDLLKTVASVYEKKMRKKPQIEAVHAGLECGVFFKKMKNLDAVSLGPDMFGVHTPKERLSISSSARIFELLKAILVKLK